MSRVFKTWVPNVSGALSFSAIGSGCYPTQPVRANVGDQKKRYLVAFQYRNLLDAVIPFLARKKGLMGDFVSACVAVSSDDPLETNDFLEGRLFIFHDPTSWKKLVEPVVIGAQEKLRTFAALPTGTASLFDHFGDTYSSLLSGLPGLSSFYVDFTLTRSGITCLTIPDDYASRISPSAPEFPFDPLQREHSERIVCSQLFFFLKDLCHNHQHHDPKADTIIDIHPFTGDELQWRAKVLRVLYRKIIEYKRSSRQASFHSSLGILIYAKSLRGITFRELAAETVPPVIQDDLLENAIKAGIQNTCFTSDFEKKETNWGFYVTLWTFVLTVAMLLSITEYKVTNPDAILKLLGDILVKHTAPVFAAIYIGYLLKNLRFRGKRDLADYKITRTTLILLQPLNQKVAAFLSFVAGILMLLGSVLFLKFWYPSLFTFIKNFLSTWIVSNFVH